MNCTRVDHVGIAVKDLAASVKWYEETLGLHSKGTEVVQEQQVTVAFLPCGDSELELLESTSPEGPIARFIEKNGEGIQHIAIRVDDIDAALAELKEKGVRIDGDITTVNEARQAILAQWTVASGAGGSKLTESSRHKDV